MELLPIFFSCFSSSVASAISTISSFSERSIAPVEISLIDLSFISSLPSLSLESTIWEIYEHPDSVTNKKKIPKRYRRLILASPFMLC